MATVSPTKPSAKSKHSDRLDALEGAKTAARPKPASRRKAVFVPPPEKPMKVTAKLFRNGRSQAVRLPKEFQFEGKEVRISRTKNGGVLLEPEIAADASWAPFFAKMDELNRKFGPFEFDRNQPGGPQEMSPEFKKFFDIRD